MPLELREANRYVQENHRHHAPVYRDKWRLGVVNGEGDLIGVLQAGRPVARHLDDGFTLEIVRVCTDGTPNACTFLLGRAARIANAMGYTKLVSYILHNENGTSYKAAGWHKEAETRGHSWDTPSRRRTTTAPTCDKQRWAIDLKP